MWRDNGLNIQFEEGQFWIDNQVVKGFDSSGNQCYLYRIKTTDSLEQSITPHKDLKKYKNITFETWEDTVKRLTPHLNEIEKYSLELLSEYKENTDRRVIVLNSTGKDSMVTMHLTEKAELKYESFFNVTTLDVKESNQMAKEQKLQKIYPNIEKFGGFYQWRKRENIIPSRLNRCCCLFFKENPTIESFNSEEKILFLLGMRNSESTARSGYTDIWRNEKWGNRDWTGLLPIREWSDLDVWLYIFKEQIPYNKKYTYGYDRVGCGIACPNYTKTTWILDKYWYPKMYERWRNILKEDFIKNNKWIIMNCTIDEYCQGAWCGGVYRTEPTQEVIQEYSQHSDIDTMVAEKYFNRYCINNCKNKRGQPLKIKDKETLAMNMKFNGRNTEKFMCKKCLMKYLGLNKDEWCQRVAEFKNQGCKLF